MVSPVTTGTFKVIVKGSWKEPLSGLASGAASCGGGGTSFHFTSWMVELPQESVIRYQTRVLGAVACGTEKLASVRIQLRQFRSVLYSRASRPTLSVALTTTVSPLRTVSLITSWGKVASGV